MTESYTQTAVIRACNAIDTVLRTLPVDEAILEITKLIRAGAPDVVASAAALKLVEQHARLKATVAAIGRGP